MMPPGGAAERGHQIGTLARIVHEHATTPEIGEWLAELGRLLRRRARARHRAARPPRLGARAARARRSRSGALQGAFRRPGELAGGARRRRLRGVRPRAAAQHRAGARVRALPGRGRPRRLPVARSTTSTSACAPTSCDACSAELGTAARRRSSRRRVRGRLRSLRRCRPTRSAARWRAIMRRVGVDSESWRLDVSTHPFSASMARTDQRMTTRYDDGGIESLLSSLHEFGHALYEHQIDARSATARTSAPAPRCRSTSRRASSGRTTSRATRTSRRVLAAELAAGGYEIRCGPACTRRWLRSSRR